MYDYDEACPISMAASVLCERWTLQILREMFFGSTKYSEIQKFIPNISPSLLRDRLRSLESQGLVMRKRAERGNPYEYFLTPSTSRRPLPALRSRERSPRAPSPGRPAACRR